MFTSNSIQLQGLHVRLEHLDHQHVDALLNAATESRETYQ